MLILILASIIYVAVYLTKHKNTDEPIETPQVTNSPATEQPVNTAVPVETEEPSETQEPDPVVTQEVAPTQPVDTSFFGEVDYNEYGEKTITFSDEIMQHVQPLTPNMALEDVEKMADEDQIAYYYYIDDYFTEEDRQLVNELLKQKKNDFAIGIGSNIEVYYKGYKFFFSRQTFGALYRMQDGSDVIFEHIRHEEFTESTMWKRRDFNFSAEPQISKSEALEKLQSFNKSYSHYGSWFSKKSDLRTEFVHYLLEECDQNYDKLNSIYSIQLIEFDANTALAEAHQKDKPGYVFLTDDAGKTWSCVNMSTAEFNEYLHSCTTDEAVEYNTDVDEFADYGRGSTEYIG